MALTNEHGVAGAILIEPSCIRLIEPLVSPADFSGEMSGAVYAAALSLAEKGQPVDVLTIQAEAQRQGTALESSFLMELMESTPTAANVEFYAREVRKEAHARELRSIAQGVFEQLENGVNPADVAQGLVDQAEKSLKAESGDVEDASASLSELFNDLCAPNRRVQKLETGFTKLDAILGGGMIRGGMYVLAGRPGMGKTTLALAIAEDVAARGKKTLFVSMEMDKTQLNAKRLACAAAVPYDTVYSGRPDPKQLESLGHAAAELSKHKLVLSDRVNCSVRSIGAMARRIKGLEFIVIDYMGLIQSPGSKASIYEKVSEISRNLKVMAMQLGVPVLVLCQLNREATQSADKRPKMHQLRDSGSIEQDADGIIMFHRPDYYETADTKPMSETAEIIVAKNRHGATGKTDAIFYGATGRIYEKETKIWNKK